jgi:hypothetical protein
VGKSGGCALKAVRLTSGDLLLVSDGRLTREQSRVTERQKSAEGIVAILVAKARTVRQGTDKGSGKYAADLVDRQAAENPASAGLHGGG